MIKFLYGPDTYRSRQELKKIIDDYDGFDFIRIDCDDFQKIKESVNTVSMFDEKKLIVLENAFSQEELLEFLKKGDFKNVEIVIWDEEPDKRTKLFKFLQKNSKEFSLLKGFQLKNWIKEYIKDGEIENIDKLIEYVGSDLWRMSNEINKLLSYDKKITNENIELLVKPELDLNIFHLVDALGFKDKNKALKLFKEFLEKGEDANYLLSMFVYQIRNLLKVKSGGGRGLHPFVFKKSQQQARNFDFDQLKKIYHQLLVIDIDTKTGRMDSTAALELFLADL